MENKKGCACNCHPFYRHYRAFLCEKQFFVIYITQLTLKKVPVHNKLLSKAIKAIMTVLSLSYQFHLKRQIIRNNK